MNINLNTLSDAEIATLIQSAAAELAGRLSASPAAQPPVASPPAAGPRDAPSEDEVDFCMYVKGLLQSGQYIKAGERQRMADIASRHASWVRRQGLPTDAGTGSWKHAQHYLGARRAKVH